MNFINVTIENSCAHVLIDRAEARNALSTGLMEELRDTARQLQTNTAVHAVVLSGGQNFSAGADLAEGVELRAKASTKLEQREALKLGPDMCKAWEDIEAFTIAAVEGYCIGGGSALVCSLDYRIAGRSAFFRLPEIPLGMNMSWNAIPRLVAQLGPARTKEYVILARKIKAEQALEWGLCEQLVDDGSALNAAMAVADEIAALPPLAVRMSKQAINATSNALANASCFMDRDQYLLAAHSEDYEEAITAFLEKRPANFKGN